MRRLSGYLLDTNVLSESLRAQPEAQVMQWLDALQPEQMFVSVLSLGEIRKGALLLRDARRRKRLLEWLEGTLPLWFENRVLAIDASVCARWAELMAKAAGQPLPAIDSLLAATALHAGLSVATRNVRDFVRTGVPVVDPWGGA